MATEERVKQMRQQGMTDPQIIQTLRQEGATPRDIEESLSTSNIKYAVDSNNEGFSNQNMPPIPENPEMEMSMASQGGGYQDNTMSMQESIPPIQEYYPEFQGGGQYPEYQAQQSLDVDVINEIVEQTIDEKIEGLKKQITSFTKFKEDAAMELGKIDERLTAMEESFNDLQMAILKKIGNFGADIENISKEMQESQYSFSKIINPLTDNIRELQRIADQLDRKASSPEPLQPISSTPTQIRAKTESRPTPKEVKEERKITKKSKQSFEEFLR